MKTNNYKRVSLLNKYKAYILVLIATLGIALLGCENKAAGAEQEYYSFTSIAAGENHTVGIDIDGTLWSWGRNDDGELGDGTTANKSIPIRVQKKPEEGPLANNTTKWKAVSAGAFHTVGLAEDGALWSWGYNGNGELGDGTTTNRNTPVRVQQKTEAETFVNNTTKWKAVSGGGAHTVGLAEDGSLWSWGKNDKGQLGDGTKIAKSTPVRVQQKTEAETFVNNRTKWKTVSAGGSYTVGITEDGSLWSWGDNGSGQLGLGNLGTDASGAAITQISLPQKIGNKTWSAVAVSLSGFSFTVGIDIDGTLWSWGYNGNGELGDGTTTNRNTPVRVQKETEAGAFEDNTTKWETVSVGNDHTVGIAEDGTLWSWGLNSSGQLGDGTNGDKSTPVQVQKTETTWKTVVAGDAYTVAIDIDGTLWSWGSNDSGRLGDGTTIARNTPVKPPK